MGCGASKKESTLVHEATEEIKEGLVDSWIKSSDIDLFSPQMYTSGEER